MKKTLIVIIMVFAMFFAGPLISQQSVSAASCSDKDISFLGFPTWYRGLISDPTTCKLKSPTELGLSNYIWHIVLNIIDILMMAIGYISVVFIIYGGFQYLTSAGSADAAKRGKASITNAIIGLVLSLVAVAIINLVFTLWT